MNSSIFPVAEYLVPEVADVIDEEFVYVDAKLMFGLPQKIELDADIHIYVVIPNGLANVWRDNEPALVLSHSDDEVMPHNIDNVMSLPNADRIPARLLVRRAAEVKASVPLVSNLNMIIDASSASNTALIELNVLGWDLRSGVLRDNGDYGARLRFAWRRIEKGIEKYSTPPVNPYVITRLNPVFKMESVLGLTTLKVMSRFSSKQQMMKVVQ